MVNVILFLLHVKYMLIYHEHFITCQTFSVRMFGQIVLSV